MTAHQSAHIPVLCEELVAALAPQAGAVIVDGTFGRGGHTRALLAAAPCRVLAVDRDPEAIEQANRLAATMPDRLSVLPGHFGDLQALVSDPVDGVALDLGVSSPQLDQPGRGFSFQADGPLDMRMDLSGPSAADLVNTLEVGALARIIRDYGEERYAGRVARAIVAARPFERTGQLADVVRGALPRAKDGIDPATRTFQGLRIAVNDELGELGRGLRAAEQLLRPGGRLAVIAFHSLEDRQVKRFLMRRAGQAGQGSRHQPQSADSLREPSFVLPFRKPAAPTDEEIRRNPRARSARLRAAERTAAAPWPTETEEAA